MSTPFDAAASVLFTPAKLGGLTLKNRFVQSGTYEGMGLPDGGITDEFIDRYRRLARGGAGLVIPGYFYIRLSGRSLGRQPGIDRDDLIPGLARLTGAVHQEGGRIAFQLGHAGRQTTKAVAGVQPISPSSVGRDPANFVKPREMTDDDIEATIADFAKAAARAARAGADAVQVHAAHGYLINQFLSPFLNVRTDRWGGSPEGRFLFMKKVVEAIHAAAPGMPVLVKLSADDHTPTPGVTPALCAQYARMLAGAGVDGIELSSGTTNYSMFNMARGRIPYRKFVKPLPWWKKPLGYAVFRGWSGSGKYDFVEGYNLETAKQVKLVIGRTALMLVGGMRTLSLMEEIIAQGHVDFISMARPFIREPNLVERIHGGHAAGVSCTSCNNCAAALFAGYPTRCYAGGLPF